MGILKKAGKLYKDIQMAGVVPPGMGSSPTSALFGSLSDHIGHENKQHAQHIHIHEHKKKK